MFDTHFGLTENPFHVIPSQKFYFPSLQHEHICQQLVGNIRQRRGLILLTGQTGSGKTLTVKQAISQLSRSTTVILYQNQADMLGLMTYLQKTLNLDEGIDDPDNRAIAPASRQAIGQQDLSQLIQDIRTVDINQLARVISQQALPSASPQSAEHNPFRHYLHEQFERGHNVVLFIDNVSDVEKNTLNTLLALSKLEETDEQLLQIVVSCSPAIGTVLSQHDQDNVTTCQLLPLQNKEIAPYIDHLLRIAGYTDKFPFTSEATRKVAAHSQGIPSLINYLCRSALFTASFEQQQTITAEMIDAAACSYVNQTNNEIVSLPPSKPEQRQTPDSNEFAYEAPQKNTIIKPTASKQKPAVESSKVSNKKIIRIPATANDPEKKQRQAKPATTKKIVASPRILHPVSKTDRPEVNVKQAPPKKIIRTSATMSASRIKENQLETPEMNAQRTLRPASQTNNPELKTQQAPCSQSVKSTGNIVRSTGNQEQSHESWRLAVYDSLLLFVTIGCVVTLYQFQTKGIDNLHTSGDVFAAWNDLEQLEQSTSPLAKKVVLRIANLNPFSLKILPALAAAFLKEQGADSVDTLQSGAGSRTIVQGHFNNTSGTTSTHAIEIEPVSIHSRYKGMTTGKANIGISLAHLSQETLASFQDKKPGQIMPNDHTLALASVAVVVNPSNPVNHLSTEKIADIFQGKINNWRYLDGKQGNIQIHTLGGDHEYLQNVLTHSLDNIKIVKSIQHDTPEQLTKAIAEDTHSVGLVNVADIGNMKALAVSTESQKAMLPSPSNSFDRGYPLAQAVHIYALNTEGNTHINKFLEFIYSSPAQTMIEQNGLTFAGKKADMRAQQNTGIDPEIFYSLTEQAQQLSANIRFNSTMAILNDVSQKQIDRVTDLLKQLNLQEDKLVILGYCYNSEFTNSNITISEERAEAVAKAFEARGIVPAVVKGLGSWNPNGNITHKEMELSGDQLPEIQIWTNL